MNRDDSITPSAQPASTIENTLNTLCSEVQKLKDLVTQNSLLLTQVNRNINSSILVAPENLLKFPLNSTKEFQDFEYLLNGNVSVYVYMKSQLEGLKVPPDMEELIIII